MIYISDFFYVHPFLEFWLRHSQVSSSVSTQHLNSVWLDQLAHRTSISSLDQNARYGDAEPRTLAGRAAAAGRADRRARPRTTTGGGGCHRGIRRAVESDYWSEGLCLLLLLLFLVVRLHSILYFSRNKEGRVARPIRLLVVLSAASHEDS